MIRLFAPVSLALYLLPALLQAQSDSATISGLVTENSGSVLVGAQVNATNIRTKARSTALANQNGVYVLRNLRPGEYRLDVENEGFQQIVLVGLVLSAQDAVGRNFRMQIGSVIQSLTITSAGQEMNISPAVGTVVNQQFVENLPLNGHSFQSLIALTPGVVLVSDSNSVGQFSVNGQRGDSNYFTVDGVSANFGTTPLFNPEETSGGTTPTLTVSGSTTGLLSVDAMQEFRIQTSTFAPEYGRSPAQVSIVTRSGTEEYRGTAYDYLRNNVFDARNYFDRPPLPQPPLRQNDFGGTIGGPIKGNIFFFFSYEGLRLLLPQTSTDTFYTAAARQNVAPVYRPLMAAFPLPDGPTNPDNLTASLTVGYSNPSYLDAYSLRLDHTFKQRLTLFGRYNYAPSTESDRFWSEVRNLTVNSQSATVGATLTLRGSRVNDLRANWAMSAAGVSATLDNFHGAVPPPDSARYLPGYSGSTSQFVLLPPVGGSELRSGTTAGAVQRQLNLVDAFSLSVRTHQLKFGGDFRHLTPTSRHFISLLVIPQSYQNLQSGSTDFASTENMIPITAELNNSSLFAQDIWKVSPRLALTYGLRWEVNTPIRSITPETPLYAFTGIFDSQPFGLAPTGTPLWHTRYNNFAPRVGAAFQMTPQTVLRGGFGRFYDIGYGGGVSDTMVNFPYTIGNNVPVPIQFDLANPAFQPVPFTFVPNPATTVITAVDPHLQLPFTYEWNGAIQYSLGANQSLSATYVGAHGEHLLRQDSLQSQVVSEVFVTRNAAWSNYNALQIQFQRRMTRGLQVLASYTFGKSTDTASDDDLSQGIFSDRLADIKVAADLGPSLFDTRQSFSGAISWQLPSPHFELITNALLRNWQADAIVRVSSATPYAIRAVSFSEGTGFDYVTRPDIVPGVPFYIRTPGLPGGRQINAAAFTPPVNGQQGNLSRDYFRGFPIDQTDLSLRRQFHLTERASFYLGAEFFNLFNHPMFALDPDTSSVGNLSFGIITETLNEGLGGLNPLYQIGGPRSGQITIRVQF